MGNVACCADPQSMESNTNENGAPKTNVEDLASQNRKAANTSVEKK